MAVKKFLLKKTAQTVRFGLFFGIIDQVTDHRADFLNVTLILLNGSYEYEKDVYRKIIL